MANKKRWRVREKAWGLYTWISAFALSFVKKVFGKIKKSAKDADSKSKKKKNWCWITGGGIFLLIIFLQILLDTGWKTWACEGLLLVNVIAVCLLVYCLAKAKKLWAFVPEGEIVFVVAGETLHKTIANVKGHRLVPTKMPIEEDGKEKMIDTWKIEAGEDTGRSWFNKKLGLFWLGIYPFFTVHEYWFTWPKSVAGESEGSGEKKKVEKIGIGGLTIEYRREKVGSLFFRYTYPVVATEVEIMGNIKIDIALELIVEVVYPYIPVFLLKGHWLAPFTSAIEGVIADFGRRMNINAFRDLKKATKREKPKEKPVEVSEMVETVKTTTDKKKTKQKEEENLVEAIENTNPRLIEATGMRVAVINYQGYRLNVAPEVEKAVTAQEVEKLQAKAKKEKGSGEQSYLQKVGQGKANALSLLIKEAVKHPKGAEILQEQLRTEAVVGFEGSVLVIGSGQGVTPVIPLTGEGKKKEERRNE